jgi:hypothetical protein
MFREFNAFLQNPILQESIGFPEPTVNVIGFCRKALNSLNLQ